MLNIILIVLLIISIIVISVLLAIFLKKDPPEPKKTYSCTIDGGCQEDPNGKGAFNDPITCYNHCKENQGVTVVRPNVNYIYDIPDYIPRNRVRYYPYRGRYFRR